MRYFLPACLLLFISCTKDSSSNDDIQKCNRIVEVQDYHPYGNPVYQRSETLVYDDKGRIKTVTGVGQNKSEYFYYKDSIVLKATDIDGVDIGVVYYLNNLGRIARTNYANEAYTYNADGYLVSFKQPYGYNGQINGYTPYFLKWENGNLIEVYTNDQTVSLKKVSFQYYDQPAQNLLGYNESFYIGEIVGDRNSFYLIDGLYFGKKPEQLLKSTSFNDAGFSADRVYHSDSKGRITAIGEYYRFSFECP